MPVIICMPALGVPASYYEPLAYGIVNIGCNVITADLRGNGLSSVKVTRSVNYGYHEMITYDWVAIVNTARKIFPNAPIILLGHSLGGQLSTLYSSINTDKVDGIILVAAGSVFFMGWRFPYNISILFVTQLSRVIAGIVGYFPGKKIGFGGNDPRRHIKDWAMNCMTGRYNISNSHYNFDELLENVRIPVLSITLDKDLYAPLKSAQNLCEKMKQADIKYIFLNSNETDERTLYHFKWVKYNRPVIEKIEEWLKR